MITHMMVQYSDLWWATRCGIPTASRYKDIITAVKGDLSKSAPKYAAELVAEVLCQNPKVFSDRIMTRSMQAGRDTEPRARAWYEMEHDTYRIQQVGFITNDSGTLGASPDGMINLADDRKSCEGCLELKCPQPDTHVEYMMDPDSLLQEYKQQVHGQLCVTGCQWVDLVSYCDGFDPVIVRVTPNEYTVRLAEALAGFLRILDATAKKVRGE